jgi:hypothetical protein
MRHGLPCGSQSSLNVAQFTHLCGCFADTVGARCEGEVFYTVVSSSVLASTLKHPFSRGEPPIKEDLDSSAMWAGV